MGSQYIDKMEAIGFGQNKSDVEQYRDAKWNVIKALKDNFVLSLSTALMKLLFLMASLQRRLERLLIFKLSLWRKDCRIKTLSLAFLTKH